MPGVPGRRSGRLVEEMSFSTTKSPATISVDRTQGRGMNGRAPATCFIEGLPKPPQKREDNRLSNRAAIRPSDAARSTWHCESIALSA